jgi:hypothetical protein
MSTAPQAIDRYESTFVVSLDPTKGDFTSVNDALNALPASGGKIFVKAGVYPLSATIAINTSNVQIQGEGMGITTFVLDASLTGNTPAIEAFSTAVDGAPRVLRADTARGDISVQVLAADAATFAIGDYVLLSSNKSVDTEVPTKLAGELKRIAAVDTTTGVITMDDRIFDGYTLTDSAKLTRVTVLENITLSDFSVTTNAPFSNLRVGFTHFRFVENLNIERVEVHHAYYTGIHLQTARNSSISRCYIHHISDIVSINPPNPANARYGIVVGCASQNITISGCRFSHTRHAFTTGGSSGQNSNGVQRNIVVANCTSMATDTAHFDTHQPAENVTFIGCVADGGVPASSEAYGFQMRGRNCSVIGCSVLQAVGRGIFIFGPVSSGAVISDNMIANVKAIGSEAGNGIYFDSAGTSNHSVIGNVMKDCEGPAIANGGGNNDIVISGNTMTNVNTALAGAAIQLSNTARVRIAGNNISSSSPGPAIALKSSTESVITNNTGYNPVGVIPNPWPATGGDLTNHPAGGSAAPRSGVVYVVRETPKTIVVSGGSVSRILIDGANCGATAGSFKLGVGESIAITFSGAAPATQVFGE